MRVCDLTTLYIDGGEGGVNTYLYEKARDFAGRPDVEHLVVVPGERTERRRLFGSQLITIKSPRLPSNPEHRVLAALREVRRLLRDERPDVVEVDCAYLLGQVARAALPQAPVVGFYHVHLPTFIARPRASRLGPLVAATAERATWRYVDLCNRNCDRVVVSSPTIEERLRQAGFRVPLEQIPLGVNLALFQPRPARAADGPREVLYVGRLSREKDLDVLIAAFQRLCQRRPQERYRLTLIGEGPMRRELERRAAGDPRVRFLGRCPYGQTLAERYREADVLAVPSPNETFNLTVLEGLASGLPVVAVRQGGPRDLVGDEIGALARPGDPDDFARALAEVAGRGIAPETCREHVEATSSWQRTCDRLLALYEELASSRARAASA
ncbi:MAG: glycosyltransferase [Planctomycetota bacterium]